MSTGTAGDGEREQTDDVPPNIVLIISDDQGWTDYGFMGHETIRTPNIDRLAEQSLTFTRGYVPTSLCRPSLATLATGLYPHQHQIVGNDPMPPNGVKPWDKDRSDEAYWRKTAEYITNFDMHQTVPRLLRKQIYLSHQSGKWWEGSFKRGGFTHGMTEGFPNPDGRHGDRGLTIGRKSMKAVFDFIDMAERRRRPFFLWYAPFMPHKPHNPPERLLEKYRDEVDSLHLAKYYAMCEWFDETVGELLGYLKKKGISENTMVLYVADNGWLQEPDEDDFAPRSKQSVYDGGLRTPVMIRWPREVEPAMNRETPVSTVDLAPTILRAAGIRKIPEEMPGVNLLNEFDRENREAVFGATYYHDVRDIHRPVESLKYRWCVKDRWKLILPYKKNLPNEKVQLYDLEADPHEKNNLAAEHPDRVSSLRKRIRNWWTLDGAEGQ